MKRCITICAIAITILISACNDNEHEKELEKREQILLQKENEFALKQADYDALLKMRDSLLAKKDTTTDSVVYKAWPAEIAGQWNSKVICTASNCSDYIVGDQRSDVWDFISDSSQMITKITGNKKLVRVYLGSYDGSQVKLNFSTDSTSPKHVIMNVLLNDIQPDRMKGTRTINIDSSCTAEFSIELNRAENK
jgi:hypothetical protein